MYIHSRVYVLLTVLYICLLFNSCTPVKIANIYNGTNKEIYLTIEKCDIDPQSKKWHVISRAKVELPAYSSHRFRVGLTVVPYIITAVDANGSIIYKKQATGIQLSRQEFKINIH